MCHSNGLLLSQLGDLLRIFGPPLFVFQENPDISYAVKYEIKEGDCPVKSGKTWQECDYKDAEKAVRVLNFPRL